MRFSVTHRFDHDAETVAEALLDPDYQASLVDISKELKGREVLSQEEHDGKVVRRIRSVIGVDLGPAKRFVGNAEPAWVEEATWDPETMTWQWKVVPEVAGQILKVSGTIALQADGQGTDRVVEGDVRVRVPLYGGRVEQIIVDHLKDGYDEEADRLRRWLERA